MQNYHAQGLLPPQGFIGGGNAPGAGYTSFADIIGQFKFYLSQRDINIDTLTRLAKDVHQEAWAVVDAINAEMR